MSQRLWSPGAAASALKTTTGIIIAWAIVLWYQWPDPFLAPIAVLFLQTPYLGASLRKGLMRVFGTLAGALLVLVLLAVLIQDRWALLTAISLVLAGSVYMLRHSRYGYAWFMVAITTAIIATEAATHPSLAFELAVYRTSEAVVGILVVLSINGILWPRRAGDAYNRLYDETLSGLAQHLCATADAVARVGTSTYAAAIPRALLQAPMQLREILIAAALDTTGFRQLRSTREAQIRGVTAILGVIAGLTENLKLTEQRDPALLTPAHRDLIAERLRAIAAAVSQTRTIAKTGTRADADPRWRTGLQPDQTLLAKPRPRDRLSGSDAVLLALGSQLDTLTEEIGKQQAAAAALAADRALPTSDLPAMPRDSLKERLQEALPNALVMLLVFWLLTLIWIWLQWPPAGFLGVLMGVVIVGIETIQNRPAQGIGKRITFGATTGILIAMPIYGLVLPRLDGFFELALILFPLFFAISYCLHALPVPKNLFFTGMGLATIIMLQIEPRQQFDLAAWFGSALSLLTGYWTALTLLAITRPQSPSGQFRRVLTQLLQTMQAAQRDLTDLSQPDFDIKLGQHEHRLRQTLQSLAPLVPYVQSAPGLAASAPKLDTLTLAMESLVVRFRGLQHERARWSGHAKSHLFSTSLGRTLSPAFEETLAQFIGTLSGRAKRATAAPLDQARSAAREELARLEHHRDAHEQSNDGIVYTLVIAAHYIAVAQALRTLADAINAIDWRSWQAARF